MTIQGVERRLDIKLIYLAAISSLIASNLISINLGFMELSLFRILIIGLSLKLILANVRMNRKISLNFTILQSNIIKFHFFWLIYSFFTLLWVKDYYSWARAFFYIAIGFLTIIIFSNFIKEKKHLYKVFQLLFLMIVIHNIIGLSEILTGHYMFADMSKIDRYSQFGYNAKARVPVSMFVNTNDFATILSLGVFISYIIFSNCKSKLIRLFIVLNMITSTYLIIRTDSRANILGLLLGVSVFIFLKYLKNPKVKTIGVIAILVLPLLNPNVLKILYDMASSKLSFSFTRIGSDEIRLGLIKNGFSFLYKTFLFGVGAGNIEHWVKNYNIYYVGTISNMHNWWMEILVGYGVFIFLGYILTYFYLLKTFYISYITTTDLFVKNTSLALVSLLSCFVISSMSSSSIMGSSGIWMIWSVMIAYVDILEEDKISIS